MIKKLAIVALGMIVAGTAMGEGISWFANNNWMNEDDGTTRLTGSTDSSLGAFVQLIWDGGDGIDSAINSGDGTTGTDTVVDKRWVGAGAAGGADGWFSGGSVAAGGNVVSGRVFYARAWDDPASDYSAGTVSTAADVMYGNSPTWTYPHSDPVADNFDVTGTQDLNTTLYAVPEPTVALLSLVGLFVIRAFRRKR